MDQESGSKDRLNASLAFVRAASTATEVSRFQSLPCYELLSSREKKVLLFSWYRYYWFFAL